MKFDGLDWHDAGELPLANVGRQFTGIYTVSHWQNDLKDERVLVVKSKPLSSGARSAGWDQLVIRQKLIDGKWEKNGLQSDTFPEGRRIDQTYVAGKREGWERVYFASGALERETMYANDKRNGIGKAFDESGKPLWEATYANDVEVSSKRFSE